ncbi:acyl-CoA dehydrogenase family protein [Mycolicibacterium monacense]|uniref:Acyl-CoA dehydrogenase n=1 Tax=Mycolicibacterium monacense TaxID=85693 RepID=A0AAD1J0P9_MYCMB|nr:acyl-CoA dehydrogenase family protein [Mycolicibacterium monacense]MDA4103937.1 acyl-CoA dehydrogenase [Mycolicibacterium monacense DSM 44395]ORB23179.1 acyl-CoA dehydrogenase [Mycolicibacterium monacense DSM 44395]QHP85270.1 acyl-CoA dehydrogenase [Mycolicibacterium monacense DSM 44395]BBZ61876.1 acyl-CoA dehydrogenase [Mycolicibacterium monacense]
MTETLTREAGTGTPLAEYLQRVRAITPLIRAEAEGMERAQTLSDAVRDAIAEQDLHRMLVPTELGGGGLLPSEGLRVYEEMAKADASTAWAFMATSWSTAEVLGYLKPEVAKDLMSRDEDFRVAGQLLPRYPAKQVEGGLIVEGNFAFASGSDHATWIGAGVFLADEDGNAILGEDGQPQPRVAMFPKAEIDLKQNWDVWGLGATGSHDYRVDKKFAPDEHTIVTFGGTPYRSETIYKLSNEFVGPLPHVPVVLGIATRALELLAAVAIKKFRPNYGGPIGEADIFKIEFARMEALLHAVRLSFYDLVESTEATVDAGHTRTPEQMARMRQQLAFSHETMDTIVGFAHRWSGSQSIGRTSTLGRYVRDMQVATQHLLVDPKFLADAATDLLPIYAAAGA